MADDISIDDEIAAVRGNSEMDQWKLWRLTDSFGSPVYIKISHYPHDGAATDAYDDLDASPPVTTSEGE